jgi:hypothetical protein
MRPEKKRCATCGDSKMVHFFQASQWKLKDGSGRCRKCCQENAKLYTSRIGKGNAYRRTMGLMFS